ncbi:MAG: hypothetical protein FJW68_04285 [Actinobacteria bacterium]|nr:hypothetical protein [Actinomycetota bacterium]
MDGKLILGFLNYLTVGIVFLLGLISLLITGQKKKLTFLFLMFISAGMMSFLFFAGFAFIMPSISIVGFCIILNLFIQNQEFFGSGNSGSKNPGGYGIKLRKNVIILKFLAAVLITAGLGFLFFAYNDEFFKNISTVTAFNTAPLFGIINDISENYMPLIFIFIIVLFMSVVWFIAILNKESKKN